MIAVDIRVEGMNQSVLSGLDSNRVRALLFDASKKTVRQIRTLLMRGLRERGKGLSLAYAKRRLVVHHASDQASSSFWLGTNPMPVHWYGKPHQTKAGVKLKGVLYRSSFVQRFHPHKGVWQRKSAERLPIFQVTDDTFDDSVQEIWQRIERRVSDYFNRQLSLGLEKYLHK